jgi:multidrug efflux pump subunit AcrA (membrane-fusion protein)
MTQTSVFSDLNGSVWKILVSEGDLVAEDDTLAVLESMNSVASLYAFTLLQRWRAERRDCWNGT